MNDTETEPVSQAEEMAELKRAIEDSIKGIRDPVAMARAYERMKRGREELRQQYGERDLAVKLIREGRDEE